MKNVLITSEHGFIGTALKEYLSGYHGMYSVRTVSLRAKEPAGIDMSGYDCVVHTAGIAHSDTGKAGSDTQREYYRVNADLALQTAMAARASGVGQFIYLSSAIIYGPSAPVGRRKRITKSTPPAPENFYGDSKLRGERQLLPLSAPDFKIARLRLPMVYGPGCKGNYLRLSRLAAKLPLIPYTDNERSMLYIGNLTEFIRLLIDGNEEGLFFPQNAEYVNTSGMMRAIAAAHGRHTPVVRGFGPLMKTAARFLPAINKAFGSLSYDMELSVHTPDYRVCDFEESIRITEEWLKTSGKA